MTLETDIFSPQLLITVNSDLYTAF